MLIGNNETPQLMNYGSAVFKPGQNVETHKHDTMYEVFHITSVKAKFTVNNKRFVLLPGNCNTIEPSELHLQNNPFNQKIHWIYSGIATD